MFEGSLTYLIPAAPLAQSSLAPATLYKVSGAWPTSYPCRRSGCSHYLVVFGPPYLLSLGEWVVQLSVGEDAPEGVADWYEGVLIVTVWV